MRELSNSHQFDSEMAGRSNFRGNSRQLGSLGLETPLSTPAKVADRVVSPVSFSDIKRPLKDLQKLDKSVGPRLFMKRTGRPLAGKENFWVIKMAESKINI